MYNFVNINVRNRELNNGFSFYFNNRNIINEFNNELILLTVSGRDIVNSEARTQSINGRDGIYFLDKKFNSREIEIKVLLKNTTRSNYEKLNKLLYTTEPANLTFSDENNRFYNALFIGADVPEENSKSSVFSLKFICYDPFKYSDIISKKTATVDYNGDFPTFPKITIKLLSNTNEIRLLHLGKQQYIRLTGTYLTNNIIVIDMGKRTITLNGRNDLHKFDMVNSRFFNFSKGRNYLSINGNHEITVEYREVFL